MSQFIRGNMKFDKTKWLEFEVSYHRRELKFVVDGKPIASYRQKRFYRIRQFIKSKLNILKGGEYDKET